MNAARPGINGESSPRRRQGGFTLVEVIVAVGVTLILVGATLAFYDHAMTVRRELLHQAALAEAHRVVMDRITDDLRSSLRYPFLGMALEGTNGQMLVTTAVLPGPAAWAVRKSTDDPVPPEHDVQIVNYRLRTSVADDGSTVVEGLERTARKVVQQITIADTEEMMDDPAMEVQLVSSLVKFLALRYWDGTEWVESWGGGQLPAAVEVTIGFEQAPSEVVSAVDYPYESFRRVVALPVAPPPAADGTTVRGLGGTSP